MSRSRPSCRVGELELAVGGSSDRPPTVVDEGVVSPAQQDQVVEIGGAAVGPVDEMVKVDPAGSLATREATTFVSIAELATKPCGDAPTDPADPDDTVLWIFEAHLSA